MFLESKKLIVVNSILIVLLLTYGVYREFFGAQNLAYVDNEKLFNEFNMTKEMKRIGEKEFNTRKKELDSLYTIGQSANLPPAEKEVLTRTFMQKQEDFQKFNQIFAQEETMKIWKRIDGYVSEFGSEKNYIIIIGSDTKRDVLFAKESVNITPELITYINKKYEGLK